MTGNSFTGDIATDNVKITEGSCPGRDVTYTMLIKYFALVPLIQTIINNNFRWLERVHVFFNTLYLGVKIFRLELANRAKILPQNNDNIKLSIFCRFLKKLVAIATHLGFEV